MQALGTQLFQLCVEVAAGLTELGIGRISQPQHGKMQGIQFGGFLAEQELVQGHRFFRRLAFALCGGDQQHDVLAGQCLALVVAHAGQAGVQAGVLQAVVQLLGHPAGIAGLRGRQDGDAAGSRCGTCCRAGGRDGLGGGGLPRPLLPRRELSGKGLSLRKWRLVEEGLCGACRCKAGRGR